MKAVRTYNVRQWSNWMKAVATMLLCIIISGCYLSENSFQENRNLTHPLPFRFFLHSEDKSTDFGFSKMYAGQANDRSYEVTSNDAIVSISFEQLDRKNNIYWGLVHSVDEKGKETFFNLLAKIARGQMQIYQPPDAPREFKTRDSLVQALADKKLLESPTRNYAIYDLGKPDQKAQAEALVQANKKGSGDSDFSLDTPATIDLTRARWRPANDNIRQKVLQAEVLDEKIRVHGFTDIELISLPFYKSTSLVRVSGHWKPDSLQFYFIYDGNSLFHLNGASPVVHEYNKSHPPIINAHTAASYLWYFGFFVRSKEQPFLVLNSNTDTFYPKSGNASLQNKLAGSLKAPVCEKNVNEEEFDCKVVMLYSGSVFEADMRVARNGMLSMLSDSPLHSGFPMVDAPVTVAAASDRFELSYHPRINDISTLRKQIIKRGETPYILANGRSGVLNVPTNYLDEKGKVVLNISDQATTGLVFTYDKLKFTARFSGKSNLVEIPLAAIEAVYSKETGQGLLLSETTNSTSRPAPQAATKKPQRTKPAQPVKSSWVHDSPIENGVRRNYLYNFASTALGSYANPFLRVACGSDGVNVAIMWGKPMKNMYPESSNQEAVRVSAKFGQADWQTIAWSLSRDRFVTYPPTAFNSIGSGVDSAIFSLLGMDTISKRNSAMFEWNARSFVNLVRSNNKLVLSARDSSNRDVTLNIDLTGYRESARKHFSSRCR